MPKPEKKTKTVHMRKGKEADVEPTPAPDEGAIEVDDLRAAPEALCGAVPAGKGRKDFKVHAKWEKVTCAACLALKPA